MINDRFIVLSIFQGEVIFACACLKKLTTRV